jgi:hypothetical protein
MGTQMITWNSRTGCVLTLSERKKERYMDFVGMSVYKEVFMEWAPSRSVNGDTSSVERCTTDERQAEKV